MNSFDVELGGGLVLAAADDADPALLDEPRVAAELGRHRADIDAGHSWLRTAQPAMRHGKPGVARLEARDDVAAGLQKRTFEMLWMRARPGSILASSPPAVMAKAPTASKARRPTRCRGS